MYRITLSLCRSYLCLVQNKAFNTKNEEDEEKNVNLKRVISCCLLCAVCYANRFTNSRHTFHSSAVFLFFVFVLFVRFHSILSVVPIAVFLFCFFLSIGHGNSWKWSTHKWPIRNAFEEIDFWLIVRWLRSNWILSFSPHERTTKFHPICLIFCFLVRFFPRFLLHN